MLASIGSTGYTSHLGNILAPVAVDPFLLNQTIEIINAYSLIHRDPQTHMLTMHRLVQAVLREAMPLTQARIWMQRAILAVSTTFPAKESTNWSLCERCLPHALHCASLIAQNNFNVHEKTHLLDQIGTYLVERRHLEEAESLHPRIVAISEQQVGSVEPTTIINLNKFALIYNQRGKFAEAASLYWRALTICEQHLNSTNTLTLITLNEIVYFCNQQWDFNPQWMRASADKEVNKLENRAATIAESLAKNIYKQLKTSKDPIAIDHLDSLAHFFLKLGLPYHAELLYQRLLSIYERQLDLEPRQIITSLNGQALAYAQLGQFMKAEELHQRALIFCEKYLSPTNSSIIFIMRNLIDDYYHQVKYVEAEELYQRILAFLKQIPEPLSPELQSTVFHCHGIHNDMQELLINEHLLSWRQEEHKLFFPKVRKMISAQLKRDFLKKWEK